MYNLIKRITLVVVMLSVTFSAFALDLKQAKQQGLVGEMGNGYLGIVVNNADTQALIKDVNNKRKQVYIKLAKKNKITLKQVSALAGEKAQKKTAKGHFIKNAQDKWVKK
ncbi:MAG: hypothetical protein ACI9FJ_000457 [Alteromonadaceae bacterium]|jgi:uncharacterized protein YdbL (DUF1318 family)